MLPNTFETLIPGLREARARERLNRGLAFAGITRRVCGIDLVPLTPDHRLELQLVRNAFAVAGGVEPLEGDVFQLFRTLHPARPQNGGALGRFRLFLTFRALRRVVARMDLANAVRAIRTHLAEQLQDLPEDCGAGAVDLVDPQSVHWMAADASFWINIHGGFTLATYRRTPYLVLQQLHRAWRCSHPRIDRNADGSPSLEVPVFINASDAVVGAWQRGQRGRVAAAIRERDSKHERPAP